MSKIFTIFFVLLVALVGRTSSFKPYRGCSQTKGFTDLGYCAQSLRLNSPFIPPIPECCRTLKIDKMYCLCEGVIASFGQNFDFFKLGQLSHACGDIKPPGSYCGVYKIPGGA